MRLYQIQNCFKIRQFLVKIGANMRQYQDFYFLPNRRQFQAEIDANTKLYQEF